MKKDVGLALSEVGKKSVKYGGVDVSGGRIVTCESGKEGGMCLYVYEEEGERLAKRVVWEGGSVGSRLYGYGGGSFCVMRGGEVWVEESSQDLWWRREGEGAEVLWSSGEEGLSLGSLSLHLEEGEMKGVVCVWAREGEGVEGRSGLLYVDREGRSRESEVPTDFVTSPCFSPSVLSGGKRLVFLGWNDPYMPWDRNSVWEVFWDGEGFSGMREILGEEEGSCYFQPRWSKGGDLYVMKETGEEEGGFWNLHKEEEGGGVKNVLPLRAECGLPQWQGGMSTYDFCGEDKVVLSYTVGGRWILGVGDVKRGEVVVVSEDNFCGYEGLVCSEGSVVFLGVRVDGEREVVRMCGESLEVEACSRGLMGDGFREVWYEKFSAGEDGIEGVMVYHPPEGFRVGDEPPPVIVRVHGGPTAQVGGEADVRTVYWTSRGLGVCDVNYRGSTGFGRAYRRMLEGGWGVVDVEDIRSAARRLVLRGYADAEKMVVWGSSAGGLSVLRALMTGDEFCGGICLYGVTDLVDLMSSTHRFEAYYLESLVGKWEEEKERYRERSPLYYGEKIKKPVLFFHGGEDKVVVPSQTERMVESIRASGGRAEVIFFEGEGHGFRKKETVMACIEAQEVFLRGVFEDLGG